MFQRNIGIAEVQGVLESGETIESYPDDTPYPSRLVLGWSGTRPLHVVAADDFDGAQTYIVSVYEPDPALWDQDFRWRK